MCKNYILVLQLLIYQAEYSLYRRETETVWATLHVVMGGNQLSLASALRFQQLNYVSLSHALSL